jgi:hypothetical protein
VANQEAICELEQPLAAHLREQVVGHVLLVVDAFVAGDTADEVGDDFAPIGFSRGNDFVAARMVLARHRQVMGIERLVADDCVVAVAPGPHHGRGNIAGAGPHGQT